MAESDKSTVGVIGTGRMGAALATAIFQAGFPTTVWNRTAAKTAPLAKLGIGVAEDFKSALASDVVIGILNDYPTTLNLLTDLGNASAIAGKVLVQLSSGTPQEAREAESWAVKNRTAYLDGAIMSYPSGIGAPEGTIFYSGPQAVFDRVKPVLSALGGNPIFVGNHAGQASALDIAGLNLAVGAMLGFIQGYIVCEEEGIPADAFAETIKGLMPVVDAMNDAIFARIKAKDYAGDEATIEGWDVAPKGLLEWAKDRRFNTSIASAHRALIEKAMAQGGAQSDIAFLYEVLRKG